MAKNITILEGRETRTFGGVEKIQTNLTGGGTQYWIPEDEASEYVDTETLEVTENGYYTPTAGSFYDGVDVNVEVEPELEEITITENGTYTPSGDGFSSVSVEVDSSGSGGDPEVHGNEMSGIAQTDINAGDTVAIQSQSDEPVSVSCPMEGIATGANPSAYDGKYLYWIVGTYNNSELRRKPISKIDKSEYEVYASKQGTSSDYYNPWINSNGWLTTNGIAEGNVPQAGSIFTNKKVNRSNVIELGKYVNLDNKLYDNHLKKVNDNVPSWSYGNGGYAISSARYIYRWGGGGAGTMSSYVYATSFSVGLIGGQVDTYNVRIPDGYSADSQGYVHTYGLFPCGTNKVCFLIKDGDTNKWGIMVASFEAEAEYEGQTHDVDSEIIAEIECSGTFGIGTDSLWDRWAITTDNGLLVLYSDLTVEDYPNIKSTSVPFIAGQYVFLAGSCYQLIGDDAIMVATTSKGTDGVLGVAKHNVRAGETGTAIVLFS